MMTRIATLGLVVALAAAGPAIGQPAGPKDLDGLQGRWAPVTLLGPDGKGVPVKSLPVAPYTALVVKGNAFVTHDGDKRLSAGQLRVSPAKNPKWVEMVLDTGDGFQVHKGIYELDGDRLTLCVALGEEAGRPDEFRTDPRRWLALVLERSAGGAGPAGEDAKRLQGSWVIDPATYDPADERTAKLARAIRVVFDADTVVIRRGDDRPTPRRFRLDPAKTPKQIDLLGDKDDVQVQGIYDLSGDTLRVLLDPDFKTNGRPARFERGPRMAPLYLKREKEAAPADESASKANAVADLVKHYGGTVERDPSAGGQPVIAVSLYAKGFHEGTVARIAEAKSLQTLNLSSSSVKDEDLKHLAALPRLKHLKLSNRYEHVTDDGVRHLAGLKSLETLGLHRTAVTDDGVKSLAGLDKLRDLDLRGTKVTGSSLKALAGLQELDLTQTDTDDAGVRRIADLTGLRSLRLQETKITDACVPDLARLTGLKTLTVSRTRGLTPDGVAKLKASLPKCEVSAFDEVVPFFD